MAIDRPLLPELNKSKAQRDRHAFSFIRFSVRVFLISFGVFFQLDEIIFGIALLTLQLLLSQFLKLFRQARPLVNERSVNLLPRQAESAVEASAVEASAVEVSAVEASAVEVSAVEASADEVSADEASAVEASAVEDSAVEDSAVEIDTT